MTSMRPLVSVVMPTYNPAAYIRQALDSIFSQTYDFYEVIVVDDGSTTVDVEVLCQSQYPGKIKYLRKENGGTSTAKNMGIRASRGKYVAFLDDDDVWLPEKLEKQVNFFEGLIQQGKNPGLVYSGHQNISEDGKIVSRLLYKAAGDVYEKLLFIDFIGTPSGVMVLRSVFDQAGFFDESLKSSDDYEEWVRIAKKYEVYSLDEFLIQYRDRLHSISKNVEIELRDRKKIMEIILNSLTEEKNIPGLKKKIIRRFESEFAQRLKVAAYRALFFREDSRSFREYMKRGRAFDASIFGFKAGLYFFLSYFSPKLPRKIKNLKKSDVRDVIADVDSLKTL